MKKTILSTIAAIVLPIATFADGYSLLWKQYEEARKKDLPKSQVEILDKISKQAMRDNNYGNLLKAETKRLNVIADISTDSIAPNLIRLEQRAKNMEGKNDAVAAIYYCVLGDAYNNIDGNDIVENAKVKSEEAFDKALRNKKLLAETTALDYSPFVKKGTDGSIFNNDLLSIIGYKAEQYSAMNSFYDKIGNRKAALLTAFEMVKGERNRTAHYYRPYSTKNNKYIAKLDSLINTYGDLPECGDVALEKYDYLNTCSDVTPAQKADFISYATQKWANWRNIPRLKSEYENLTKPMFYATFNQMVLPNIADTVAIEARNIKELKLCVTRLNLKGNTELNGESDTDLKKIERLKINSSRVESTTPFSAEHAYDTKKINIALPKLKPGIYLVEISADDKALKTRRNIIAVSDMYVASMYLPNGKTRVAVLNATTGQPVEGAKIDIRYSNKKTTLLTTSANGEAMVNSSSSDISKMRAYTAEDDYMQYTGAWGTFTYYGNERKYNNTALFTDRAIYRKGQTVHVSAVAFDIDGLHSTKVASGKELTFQLYNANNKVVEEKKATTDDFGSAAVDFALPDGNIMNGQFSVRCTGNGADRKYFRVEDYKRPTFEVKLDDVSQEYHNGDTVTVTGKATTYSGVAVQGAKVAYTVNRREARWFWRYRGTDDTDMNMLTDTVTTDANGNFAMRIPVVMPEGYEENSQNGKGKRPWQAYYTFTASAQITDNAGESHGAETSITLGTQPTALSMNMPDKVLRDSTLSIKFQRLNASAKKIEGEVAYWFDAANKKYSANANENVTIDWGKVEGIVSGKHKLWAACGTDTICQDFTLFGIGDKRPAPDTPGWAYVTSQTFPADGTPVYVQVGSSEDNTHILYSMIAGKKVIESGAYDVSNGIVTTKLNYKEEYGEGILLNYMWVKNGVAYTHKYTIARPLQDKTLNMKWITFRDKLTPGQKETWTLNISRPANNDVINKQYIEKEEKGSQLLALMYDKSLDQIVKNNFSFNLSLWQNLPSTRWNTMERYTMKTGSERNVKWFKTKDFDLNKFDYSLDALAHTMLYVREEVARPLLIRGYSTAMSAKTESSTAAIMGNGVVLKKDSQVEKEAADVATNMDDNEESSDIDESIKMQVRSDMQETAFFYPALYADKNGNVDITFTLPESVTTWNFRGFAHDKNMNYGTLEGECVASKKIMVMPNMPRFVRVGDKASIATRIANTTDKDIATVVVLQMIDPATDKVVYTKEQKVTASANSTSSATFEYTANESNNLLICRISANGKDYSDGEQHYLPVLPSSERVVNTVPFTFLGKGEKEISLASMFPKDATSKKLTVEYTANPTWMMIQALPYMAQVNEKNAISLAAAYYANVLGKHIMTQVPVIKQVVELWKKESYGNESSLASALEKNQELKTLVLDETPWVMDADKEADQKKMLSTFFDNSNIDYRINSQLDALRKLQKSDGSWSWWEGMNGSPSMTAEVVEMLARLSVMTGNKNANAMIDNGVTFLGNYVAKEYEKLMKAKREGKSYDICESHAIQYLYINALLNRTLPAKEKAVKSYLLNYLRKNRQSDIYAKALMAIILQKDGKTEEAKEYVESIKQHTVSTEEMGRYFDSSRATYSWFDYRIPTQTAAIEAIKAVTPSDKATVSEMRLWLLQSKRTQAWDTPINSVNAVFAFIDGNYKELDTKDNNSMTISVDGKDMKAATASAGLGYTKMAVDIAKQKSLKIEKASNGTSWGAAYAQFNQDVRNITDNASGIKVERKVTSDNKDANALSVGDKVKVTITITADRDYDFVQVVDKRAACMEPVNQISKYGWGYYYMPKDNATNYYFDRLSKGKHIVETEYYIDRTGNYSTGTCTVQCAYSPEFTGRTGAEELSIK